MLYEKFVDGNQQINGKFFGIADAIQGKSLEDAIKAAQDMFDLPNQVDATNQVIDNLNNKAKENIAHIVPLSTEERNARKKIQNDLLEKIVKAKYEIVHDKTLTEDFGYRYPHEILMNNDKEYNKHITDLLQKAKDGKFSGDVKDEALKAEKEEFLEMHRKVLRELNDLDLHELATKDYTDADVVKDYEKITRYASLCGQFQNIQQEFDSWGIEDKECSDLMAKYNVVGNAFAPLKCKLDIILSTSYCELDVEKNRETLIAMQGSYGNHEFMDFAENIGIDEDEYAYVSDTSFTLDGQIKMAVNSEYDSIKLAFESMGVDKKDLCYKNPETGEPVPFGNSYTGKDGKIHNAIDTYLENPNLTFFDKNNPDRAITIKCDYNKMEFTRGRVDSAQVLDTLKAANAKAPKPVNGWGKFTDAVTSLFTGHKPKQEKYEKELAKYTKTNELIEKAEKRVEEDKKLRESNSKKSEEKSKEKSDLDLEKTKTKEKEIDDLEIDLDDPVSRVTEKDEIEAQKLVDDAKNLLQRARALAGDKDNKLGKTMEDSYNKYSQELVNAIASKDINTEKKSIASMLYVSQVGAKAVKYVTTYAENFNTIYDKVNGMLDSKVIDQQAKNIMGSKVFDSFYKNLDPKLKEQMQNPETAEMSSRTALRSYKKALKVQMDKDAFKEQYQEKEKVKTETKTVEKGNVRE